MSAYAGWSLEDYADPRHPSQVAVREAVARLFGRKLTRSRSPPSTTAALLTYEVTLLELARAYLLLADPEGPASMRRRAESAPALPRVRDAMMGAPDMVGGTYDNLDTELMRRCPGRLLAKAGADGMRAIGLVAVRRRRGLGAIAIKIEDGDMSRRATKASVGGGAGPDRACSTSATCGPWRPITTPPCSTPGGVEAATALPRFELAGRRSRPRSSEAERRHHGHA